MRTRGREPEVAMTFDGTTHDGIPSGRGGGRHRRLLFRPEDREALSELSCLVRSHVEAFVATAEDIKSRSVRGGKTSHIVVGSVGIRCAHCCASPPDGGVDPRRQATSPAEQKQNSGRGAMSFPRSVRLVYQAVRNFQRFHLLTCPSIPDEVKSRYLELKTGKHGRRGVSRAEYWEECCRLMGMVDIGEGIRLRNGCFADDNEVADDCDAGSGLLNRRNDLGMNVGESEEATLDGIALSRQSKQSEVDPRQGSWTKNLGGTVALTSISRMFPLQNELHPGAEAAEVDPAEGGFLRNRTMGQNRTHPSISHDAQLNATTELQEDKDGVLQLFEHAKSPGTSSLDPAQRELEIFDSAYRGGINIRPPVTVAHIEGIQTVKNGQIPQSIEHVDNSNPFLALDFADANAVLPLAEKLSREIVLDRVKLAQSTVKAIGEMSQLPLCSNENLFDNDIAVGNIGRNCQSKEEEMHLLGVELYELFSGLEWDMVSSASTWIPSTSCESNGVHLSPSDEPEQTHHQRKKREQRQDECLSEKLLLLSELGFPTALCNLVSDLLNEKNEGNRVYNSADEVEEDLLLMTKYPGRYLFNSNMDEAKLTQIHISPDSLYAREEHTTALLRAYERTIGCAGTASSLRMKEAVLLSGYSGTGKSSIVRSVQVQFVQQGACVISGKFDIMPQMKPFSAVVDALNEYCDFLAQDNGHIEHVREAVSSALGSDKRVLLDFIPNLRKILPHDVDERSSSLHMLLLPEAHRRLAFLVRELFRVTCSKANPVVLFLDDLQWSDEASLELIHALVSDTQLDGLMFVACYRNNEIGSNHPLVIHMNKIRTSENTNVTSLRVDNLDKNSVNALVSDALRVLPSQTRLLAEVVLEKTGGNALFVVQFLSSLFDSGELRFSLVRGRWEWDLESIRERKIADNMVDFMKSKFLCLAPEVVQALMIAAAFGTECSEDLIGIIERDPGCIQGVAASLDNAVSEGLMAKIGGTTYRFCHDQIRDAAYQIIKESERNEFHLQIGRYIRRNSSPEEMKRYLFVIVDQLSRGSHLLTDHNEKVELASLSLLAGQNSAAMSAFLPALAFLKVGVAMLSDSDWESHRSLCFDLYNLTAEMKFILGDFEELKDHLAHVLGQARTLEEKLRAYYVLVESLGAQQLIGEAIEIACKVLSQLGESPPTMSSETLVKNEIMMTRELLNEKTDEGVDPVNLRQMPDGNKKEAMKFFYLLFIHAYAAKKEYFTWAACRAVQLSLSLGVCRESAYGFATYGMIVCGILGDCRGGCVLGRLAISLLDRYNARELPARVVCATYGFIFSWVEPLQAAIPPLKDSINAGLSAGDTEYAMLSVQLYQSTSLLSGENLVLLKDEMRIYAKQMVELNQTVFYTRNKPLRQATMNLLGRSADPTKLVGEEMDENSLLENAEDGGDGTLISMVLFYRMWLEYLFGEHERAAETARKNNGVAKHNMSRSTIVCNHAFYSGLAALALARKGGCDEWAEVIEEAMHQMEEWCSLSEWNFQHKLELLRAEYFYLSGDLYRAAAAYDNAVELAAKHRFIHEEALALERSGIFYIEIGDHEAASRLFARACSCYDKWGACSKTAQIRELYL